MNYVDFISGFFSALSLCCGLFFLYTRKRRAPFREAFGWVMLYSAIENTLFFVLENIIEDVVTREAVELSMDLTAIPVLTVLFSSITNQDIKSMPLSLRWKWAGLAEIPTIICLCICAFSELEARALIARVMFMACGICFVIYLCIILVRYEHKLPAEMKYKNASVKWVFYVFLLMGIEIIAYIAVGLYNTTFTYYVLLCTICFILTYFINKQSPIDTKRLFEQTEEKEQEQVVKEIREAAPESLNRNDMETYVKGFLDAHPQFEKELMERSVQKLTMRDIFLCIMIVEGRRVGEISETLAISASSVEVARYRLRAKLNMAKGENLGKVLRGYV